MHLTRSAAVVAALLAAPAAAQASVALPAVTKTLPAAAPSATFVARMSGYVTVRTTGARGTDWDAKLVDVASRRVLATSSSFTSREVLQSWVQAGQRLKVVATRHSGRATALRASFTLFDVTPPSLSAGPVSLVSVAYDSLEDLDRLDRLGLDVTHNQNGGRADVVVDGLEQLKLLRSTGLSFRMRDKDMTADLAAAASSPLPSGSDNYRTYADYETELKALADQHPGLVKGFTMPHETVQGRKVNGIEIARDVDATDDGRPTFFLMGVHHAREWPAGEAVMEFAHMLVQAADGTGDPRLQDVLDNARVLIVPIVNVDGFIASRGSVSVADATDPALLSTVEGVAPPGGILAYRRKNCGGALPAGAPCELQYGIDNNRNYGNGWGGKGAGSDPNTQSFRGPGMWSEPETQNIHEISQRRPVTSLITMHTVGAQVNRPPGRGTDGLAPDELQLKSLGDAMGKATGWVSQYSFQLYDTSGTTEDWNYAAAGTLGYTIEMGPEGGQFHMPYQTGVIDQWEGTGDQAGKGLREALILAAKAAVNPKAHGILDVTAAPGTKLTLRRDFVTKASQVCTYAQGYVNSTAFDDLPEETRAVNCAGEGAVYGQPEQADFLEYKATVGPTGTLEWHVTQSTRPFVGWKFDPDAADPAKRRVDLKTREPYTLTVTRPDGTTSTQPLFIERGERKPLDLG